MKISRRKTPTVMVGNVPVGSRYPVVIQSMTNTITSDIGATIDQIKELNRAGSELIRVTINDENAAKAVEEIICRLRQEGLSVPIIGDFHFNGHKLLTEFPETARRLAKYRINPGNVGKGKAHDKNFTAILEIARTYRKPVRIGINSGSVDPELLDVLDKRNRRKKFPQAKNEILYAAMVKSALDNAAFARRVGLKQNQIILSVKMSTVPDTIAVYTRLAQKCPYALHLGLTEAGEGLQGITSSTAALAILLAQGIGDTIRVSLTPRQGIPRTQEVEVCKNLLQSLGLRYFEPSVISCPGCGRTNSTDFQILADATKQYIRQRLPQWRRQYPDIAKLTVAVMGCVVNGPGESKHAHIGICLPGITETPQAVVYADGKRLQSLRGNDVREQFFSLMETYLEKRKGKL